MVLEMALVELYLRHDLALRVQLQPLLVQLLDVRRRVGDDDVLMCMRRSIRCWIRCGDGGRDGGGAGQSRGAVVKEALGPAGLQRRGEPSLSPLTPPGRV